jgi:hypothetical protein
MTRKKAQEYRERAKTCHEAATKTRDPLAKAIWTRTEKDWLQLADESRSGSDPEPEDRR